MKVSVLMITYNQEKFISQAIDSILMQQVDFDYEIVIGEDCSTDNTRNIVISYHKKYPDKIKLLLPQENLGMQRNFIETFQACQGEYVAVLEGDDYWTSPNKLQKQVDFLSTHLDYSMCFHNVIQMCPESGTQQPWPHLRAEKISYSIEDLLLGNFIPTGAITCRNRLINNFPHWTCSLGMLDWIFNIMTAYHGKIGYIDEVMGVYNSHSGGIWSSKRKLDVLIDSIYAAQKIKQILSYKHQQMLDITIMGWQSQLLNTLSCEEDYTTASSYAKKYLNMFELKFNKRSLKDWLRLNLIYYYHLILK